MLTPERRVHSDGHGCRARFSPGCSSLLLLAFVVVPKSYPRKGLASGRYQALSKGNPAK